MAVRVKKIADDSLFSFTCAQWAMMEAADKSDWTILENTCGLVTQLSYPYAASEFFYTLDGLVAADDPLQIQTQDGVSTILFKNQAASKVLAGPVSGPDAYPTFRSLETTDLPDITEIVQDAIGAALLDTDTVDLTYSDATPYIKADVRLQMSVTSDASGVKLSGDSASPGNNKFYSTNGSGVKGWNDLPDLTETAQDAVGSILVDTNTIDFTYNDATPSIIADVRTQMSITSDASGIRFSGDSAAPGNNKLYGTDGSGVKGWYDQPSGSYTDEQAQDAVGGILVDTDTINFTYSDATPSIIADVRLQMSLTSDASGVKLSGDSAAPGNSKLYGTNGSGVKGWYDQPTAGGNYQTLRDGGVDATQRAAANFVDTARIAFTLTDDAGNNETEVTADIVTNSIGNSQLRQGAASSVIGRSATSGGDVADIAATAGYQVLKADVSGTLGWGLIVGENITDGTIATAKIADAAVTTAKINDLAVTTAKLADNAVTTVKITDLNVTTAKIANDAVTYAKIQNVSTNNRILGRITAGAGDVEELTVANMYTILGMTGVANRFALWTGANTLTSDAAFTFDAANDRMTITGTVAGLGANNAFLNLNSGAIAGATEFLRMSGNITQNLIAGQYNANNANVDSNCIYTILTGGANAGDPVMQFTVSGVVTHSIGIDNSDADKFKITPNAARPGANANSGIIMTNAAAPNVGINKDAPQHPLDVEGRARSNQWINLTNKPTVDTLGNGLGTGPVINDITGTNNGFTITFTTGTTPTNNGAMFRVVFQTSFPAFSIPVFCARNANAATDITKFTIDTVTGGNFTMKANGTLLASTTYLLAFAVTGL